MNEKIFHEFPKLKKKLLRKFPNAKTQIRKLKNDLSSVTVVDELKRASDKDRTIDKPSKIKKEDKELFEVEDYSRDRMEDWE